MKVMIVGGTGGIGSAVARSLAANGDAISFTYMNDEAKARELTSSISAKHFRYDLNSEESIINLSKHTESESYDGLVYVAAEKFRRENILKMTGNEFLSYVQKSIDGYYRVSQAFASSIKKRGCGGALVNVLSAVVFDLPPAKQASYVTAKYALLGLTKAQAVEFQPFGLRVNSVSPGMIKTNFNSDLPERFLEIYAETLPNKRLTTPEEVAHVVKFLLSAEASDLHGVNMPIHGGSTC